MSDQQGPRRARRRASALLALMTAAIVALALLPGAGPAEARPKKRSTKPAAAGTNWIVEQTVGPTVAVRLEWVKVKRAKTYEIDYVASPDGRAMEGARIQRSKRTKTVRVRSTGAAVRTAWVGGLKPGQVYCFQVRGKNGKKFGRRGPAHCKVTSQPSRAQRPGDSSMVVATYNLCSAKCDRLLPWSIRSDLALARVRALAAAGPNAGRPADVIAIQEGLYAVGDGGTFDRQLAASGLARGCMVPSRLGAVYVRNATYTPVQGTEQGMIFDGFGDPAHGACWVKVRDNATGRTFTVVGLHLLPGEGGDGVRLAETQAVMAAVARTHPGSPVVWAGDFNSSRSRPLDAPREALAAAGFDDAYDQAQRYLAPPMMNSATGEQAAVRKSWMWGDHIDRVFAPPNAAVISWRVDVRTRDGITYDTPMPSDHSPVVVELSLP